MEGFKDRLDNLSWVGLEDQGWFVVGETDDLEKRNIEWEKSKKLLKESDWSMMEDVPMSNIEKQQWVDYRKQLREITLQSGFPDNIIWPVMPENPKFNV